MIPYKDIPLLPGGWLDGNTSEFRETRADFLVRLHRELGDVARMRLFNVTAASITDPSLIHDVLVEKARCFQKSIALRMAFYPLAGKGLFTSEGDLWKRQRKLMAPLFSPAHVREYAKTMNEVIARYLDTWQDGDIIDAGREMTRITMAVVGKILFDSDTFDDADELGTAIQSAFLYVTDQSASVGLLGRATAGAKLLELGDLPPWADKLREQAIDRLGKPIPWPTPKRRALFRAVATLDAKIQEMVDERRKSSTGRDDLLTRLLHARDEDDGTVMTDRQLRDEALTLFVAGHETTATSTTWALYFLSRNPETYRRWKQEVSSLGGKTPTVTDAAHLVYTTGVFKEALRIYPPAFMLDRVSMEDVEIGNYFIPQYTALFVSPYALHRRPNLWPEPERFDPGRFTPEAESARPRLSWIPFGAGPRICIGASFATLEAQLLLAQIAQRFEFEPVSSEPIGPSYASALRPAAPVRLRLKRLAGAN